MKHNYHPIIAALTAASLTLAMVGSAFAQRHGDRLEQRGQRGNPHQNGQRGDPLLQLLLNH